MIEVGLHIGLGEENRMGYPWTRKIVLGLEDSPPRLRPQTFALV